jgi:hypothetical protein
MERDSPKVNVGCAISRRHVFGPFFFAEDSVTGKEYLDMLENWLNFIRQTHRVLLKRHLTNATRNLNAPYTHAEA